MLADFPASIQVAESFRPLMFGAGDCEEISRLSLTTGRVTSFQTPHVRGRGLRGYDSTLPSSPVFSSRLNVDPPQKVLTRQGVIWPTWALQCSSRSFRPTWVTCVDTRFGGQRSHPGEALDLGGTQGSGVARRRGGRRAKDRSPTAHAAMRGPERGRRIGPRRPRRGNGGARAEMTPAMVGGPRRGVEPWLSKNAPALSAGGVVSRRARSPRRA